MQCNCGSIGIALSTLSYLTPTAQFRIVRNYQWFRHAKAIIFKDVVQPTTKKEICDVTIQKVGRLQGCGTKKNTYCYLQYILTAKCLVDCQQMPSS